MGEHTDKVKGKIKQTLGKMTGSERLQRIGKRDEAKGKAEGAVKDLKGKAQKANKSITGSGS